MEDFFADLKYGARMLRQNPGFTTVAVLTLALGIGADTAIFSLVNALLFRPLPFRDPQRLVWIANQIPGGAGLSGETTQVHNYSDWCAQNQSFESLAAYFAFFDYFSYTLTSDGEPVRLKGAAISQNLLATLGVAPRLGRGFADEECRGRMKAVLLTDAFFWKRRFQGVPTLWAARLPSTTRQPTSSASCRRRSIFPPSSRRDRRWISWSRFQSATKQTTGTC